MDQIFANAKVRYVLPIVILGYAVPYVLAGYLSFVDFESMDFMSPAEEFVALDLIGHGLIFAALWLFFCARAKGIPAFGNDLESKATRKLLLLGIPMVGFAIFCYYLLFIPLSYVAPEFVLSWAVEVPELLAKWDQPNAWLINVGVTVLVVFVVPVVEELVFRGFLLGRLNAKFGRLTSITVTSAIFAVLHPDILGAFFFAVTACLIRFKFDSLIAPILVHVANNALVVAIVAIDITVIGTNYVYTLEEFRSYWWLAPIGAVIGIPWLIQFYRKELMPFRAI